MMTTATPSTIFTTQLHDHIDYSTVGIHRQIIVKDDKRQAVLVCLTAGTQLADHASGHDGFITVLEGQGTFTLAEQTIALAPGVLVALPANVVHSVTAIDNLTFVKVVDRHESCQGQS